jgi:CSLREA domain-containing protein
VPRKERGRHRLATTFALAIAIACASTSGAGAATITVDTNSEAAAGDGACSLREAITAANDDSRFDTCHRGNGRDTIAFDIAGSELISLTEKLPPVTGPAVIDGTTEPDYAGVPIVRLDNGGEVGRGIRAIADRVEIRGLIVTGFNNGVRLDGDRGVVAGNLVGILANGTTVGNGRGVFVQGKRNHVGGAHDGDRNLLSGNATGVFAPGDHTRIEGNYVGTDSSGNSARPNGLSGIESSGEGNQIIDNVASGNEISGIFDTGDRSVVRGNVVGLGADQATVVPNGNDGIFVGAKSGTIGGIKPGQANLVSGNADDGVSVEGNTSVSNSILGNSIFANGGEAIDLGADGITANDVGSVPDSDNGPNHRQNFPVLVGGDELDDRIFGSLDSTPKADFRLEFFLSPNTGDAEEYLGAKAITTNDHGHRNFAFGASENLPTGQFVTATATRLKGERKTDTSELSPSADVSVGP